MKWVHVPPKYMGAHVVCFILYIVTTQIEKVLLTYSMVQSPSWEANWFAASQEIPRISRNPKVHYRTNKPPPPVSILRQPNPVHIPASHLLEIHPNIIHPSTPRSPQWSPSIRFPHQDPIHPLSSPIRATCPAHLILLDFITRTILGEEYKPFNSSLCNLLHSVTSSILGPNILLNTMFPNTVSFLSSHNSSPTTATEKTVLCLLFTEHHNIKMKIHDITWNTLPEAVAPNVIKTRLFARKIHVQRRKWLPN